VNGLKAKLIIAVSVVIGLLLFAIYGLFLGAYFLTASTLLTMVLMVSLVLLGRDGIEERWFLAIIPVGVMFLSFLHVVSNSPVTDSVTQVRYYELFKKSLEIQYCPAEIQPNEEKRIAFKRLNLAMAEKCVLQKYVDMQNLVFDLSKVIYLDPAAGALDSIYTEFKGKQSLSCLDIAAQLNALCPGIMER
jgi:hypothetical protein